MRLLLRWALAAAAVWAAVRLIPGIRIEEGLGPLFAVALILGAVNALVRPILNFLACGLIFLTLGLFLLVINAAVLGLTAALTDRLTVDGFMTALLGGLILAIAGWIADQLLDR